MHKLLSQENTMSGRDGSSGDLTAPFIFVPTGDPGNVAALPASPDAQQKLKAAGIDRPVHDSGHRNWNAEVRDALMQIRTALGNQRLRPGTDAYDQRAREELEKLQNSLRQKMLREDRLTQNESAGGPATT